MAGGGLGVLDGVGEAEPAVEMGDEFGEADGFHGGECRIEAHQRACFLEGAFGHHAVEAGFSAGVELFPRHIHVDAFDGHTGQGCVVPALALPIKKGPACGLHHFQGAGQALAVRGEKPLGHGGVQLQELAVKIAREAAPAFPRGLGDGRHGREAAIERAEGQAGAASDDGELSLCPGGFQLRQCLTRPGGH